MKKFRHARVVIATSERVTLWHANRKRSVVEDDETITVECPHCGKKAFFLEVEQSKLRSADELSNAKEEF